jgi:hypothetical protein
MAKKQQKAIAKKIKKDSSAEIEDLDDDDDYDDELEQEDKDFIADDDEV